MEYLSTMKPIHCIFSVLLLGISLMLVSVPSFSADYQTGLDAYNRGDYEAALREWRPLAEQGNPYAQTGLGLMYAEGRGILQSDTEAVKWYRKAVEQSHALAQNNLGFMYATGRGVAQSDTEAVKWYRKAAEQGNKWSQDRLSELGVT